MKQQFANNLKHKFKTNTQKQFEIQFTTTMCLNKITRDTKFLVI